MNKFDEAIELLDKSTNSRVEQKGLTSYGMYYAPEVVELLHDLKEEYAPTIEMTKRQHEWIIDECGQEDIVETVANLSSDDILREHFHDSFWKPLNQKQVVQAWLHPDTIKVVEEDN